MNRWLSILVLAGLGVSSTAEASPPHWLRVESPYQLRVESWQAKTWMRQIQLVRDAYHLDESYRTRIGLQPVPLPQSQSSTPTLFSNLQLRRGHLFVNLSAMQSNGEQHLRRRSATDGSPLDEIRASAIHVQPILGIDW